MNAEPSLFLSGLTDEYSPGGVETTTQAAESSDWWLKIRCGSLEDKTCSERSNSPHWSSKSHGRVRLYNSNLQFTTASPEPAAKIKNMHQTFFPVLNIYLI